MVSTMAFQYALAPTSTLSLFAANDDAGAAGGPISLWELRLPSGDLPGRLDSLLEDLHEARQKLDGSPQRHSPMVELLITEICEMEPIWFLLVAFVPFNELIVTTPGRILYGAAPRIQVSRKESLSIVITFFSTLSLGSQRVAFDGAC